MRYSEKITAIGGSRLPHMSGIDLSWQEVGNRQEAYPTGISHSNCYFKLGFDWENKLGRDNLLKGVRRLISGQSSACYRHMYLNKNGLLASEKLNIGLLQGVK